MFIAFVYYVEGKITISNAMQCRHYETIVIHVNYKDARLGKNKDKILPSFILSNFTYRKDPKVLLFPPANVYNDSLFVRRHVRNYKFVSEFVMNVNVIVSKYKPKIISCILPISDFWRLTIQRNYITNGFQQNYELSCFQLSITCALDVHVSFRLRRLV